MKVAVLNYTGTVGKTTIAAHLLSPRMNNSPIFAIESINETAAGNGLEVEQLKGKKFRDLFKKLVLLDNAIIDVGASNVELFLEGMVAFEDSHSEVDYFIVPVTAGSKEQKETIKFIQTLQDMEIPAEKVRIVFNKVEVDAAEEFVPVINFASKSKACIANPAAGILENELYDLMSVKKLTISDLLNDQNDYKAMARSEENKKEKAHYLELHTMKSLAKSVNRNLDTVFNALFDK